MASVLSILVLLNVKLRVKYEAPCKGREPMFSRLLRFCTLAALFVLLPTAVALAEKRVALVIGNSNYRNAVKLPNPARDATAIAALLKEAAST